ncbi:MAG TPA: hypothetical protein DGG95_17980 [Cytophagales bacterium]|jgi:hypothetical protein|nr:hypothetical protein [Cytophagales bacterium]
MLRNFQLLFFNLIFVSSSFAQSDKIEFTPNLWSYWDNDGNKISKTPELFKNFNAIDLQNNEIALLENKKVENFRIELDIAGAGMAGVGFRGNDFFNYEFVYFRITSGGTKAAIQYVPVWNGSTGWMLYAPSLYGGIANYYEDEWFHVAIEVANKNLKVFVNNSSTPNVEVKLLHNDLKKGNLFLKSEFSACHFANVKLKEVPSLKDKSAEEATSNQNQYQYLTNWQISEQFTFNEPMAFWAYPRVEQELKGWQPARADKNGIVNLSKYFKHPQQTVAASISLSAKDTVTKKLVFDYSYTMTVVLNSRIIFSGKEMDNFGVMTDGEQSIDLPLKQGENQLMFYITGDSDVYGNQKKYQGRVQAFNWGFVARLNSYEGVKFK